MVCAIPMVDEGHWLDLELLLPGLDAFVDPLGVDQVAQLFAGLEVRDALGGDFDLVAGLGIAAGAGLALTDTEAAKAADLDLVAGLQCLNDGVNSCVDTDLAVAAGQISNLGDFLYQIGFGHGLRRLRKRV